MLPYSSQDLDIEALKQSETAVVDPAEFDGMLNSHFLRDFELDASMLAEFQRAGDTPSDVFGEVLDGDLGDELLAGLFEIGSTGTAE